MFGANTSAAGGTGDVYILFLQLAASPYIAAYSCYSNTFGNKYSDPSIISTNTVTNSFGTSIAYSALGAVSDVIIYTSAAYPWDSQLGFGTKYAYPSPTIANDPHSVGISNNFTFGSGSYYTAVVFGMGSSSPFLNAHVWTPGSGFGSKYSAPSTPPINAVTGVAFNPTGSIVAFSTNGNRIVDAYKWTNTGGFSSRLSGPSGSGFSVSYSVAFNADSTALIITSNASPYVVAYAWSDTTGCGTKYANPSILPTGTCYRAAFNSTFTALAVASTVSPYVAVYPWSNATGFGTKYNNPSTPIPGLARTVAFSPDNKLIAIGHTNSPYISLYEWSDSTGFGNKLDNPLVGVGSEVQGITFSNIL